MKVVGGALIGFLFAYVCNERANPLQLCGVGAIGLGLIAYAWVAPRKGWWVA